MTNEEQVFVRLADQLLEKLKQAYDEGPGWRRTEAATALKIIGRLRAQAVAGVLPRGSGGGLGISKGLGEWADGELLQVGHELERHFMENM